MTHNMSMLINRNLWFLFFIFSSQLTFAQSIDSKGTEFWLAFSENYENNGSPELSFFLSSAQEGEITIEAPGIGFSGSVTIAANIATKYIVPSELETDGFDEVLQTSIRLSSDIEFSVYGLSRLQYTTDAYLGLPIDVLGTEYIVLAWDAGVLGASEYLIVATADNTTVDITASLHDTTSVNTQVTLNSGDTYQHRSAENDDVTGTVISSDLPIAVFAGHQCANIPNVSTFYCDHLIEQLPPTNSWGTQFFTAPLAEKLNGDTFRFIANIDNTEITINGEIATTINSGEYFETLLEEASFITATSPILVSQYSNGTTFDSVTSDPFMMLIPPFEQFLDEYTFSTPTEGFRTNYVNIVVRTASISSLSLDEIALNESDFTQIFSTDYSYTQIEIGLGSHTLTGAVSGIYVYGYDKDDSYGYSGGLSLSSIASVANVELLENYEIVDNQACFTVFVSDLDNIPLQDIRVDFLVELINGSDRTDEEGLAEFCVEAGINPGEFNVTATVGNKTTSGSVTQTIIDDVIATDDDNGGGGSIGLILAFCLLWRLRRKHASIIVKFRE